MYAHILHVGAKPVVSVIINRAKDETELEQTQEGREFAIERDTRYVGTISLEGIFDSPGLSMVPETDRQIWKREIQNLLATPAGQHALATVIEASVAFGKRNS